MQAIRLQTRITPDHRIELQLPVDTPATTAEVIVLIDSPAASAAASLEAFLGRLDQSDRPRLSAEEVDRWVEQERNGWD